MCRIHHFRPVPRARVDGAARAPPDVAGTQGNEAIVVKSNGFILNQLASKIITFNAC